MTDNFKCCACDIEINTNSDDYGWSATQEDYLCIGCRESDEESASTMTVIADNDGLNADKKVKKYFIGQHIRMSEDGDDMWGMDWGVKREWVSSDAWRGHYNTTVDGWTEVLNGWTTGGWDDPTAQRKIPFNEWAEQMIKGEIIPPVAVAIIADPTSNVFSTGINVLTPDPETFKKWLGAEFGELHKSLS